MLQMLPTEDWDISNGVAWGPDYEDPSTYLDIFKTTASENTKTFMGLMIQIVLLLLKLV